MDGSDPDRLADAFLASFRKVPKLSYGPEREFGYQALQEEWANLFAPLVEAAVSGSPKVWFAMGHGYSNGWGVDKSKELAIYWFFRAAEAGHTDAMVRLALALRPHDAGLAEQREAIVWYRRAASLGNTSAMIHLGFAYREGQGVEMDYEEALRWFKAAYNGGDAFAIDKTGSMYTGYMEPRQEAVDFFLAIAETGEAESCFYLGRLFDNPAAPFHDPEKAMDWLIAAVQRGTRMASRALLELAYHCYEGAGTTRDLEGAKIWLDQFFLHAREKTQGHREGMRLLKEIEKVESREAAK